MKILSYRMPRVRMLLLVFMLGLMLSGLTAIPSQWEASVLREFLGSPTRIGVALPWMSAWVDRIDDAVQSSYGGYPFLAYPNDWLAFGHVVIAIAFIGALRDPLKNIWLVEFGIIACGLVIPWSIFFGLLRGIPLFWTMIDLSFGVFGAIPLLIARRDIRAMESEIASGAARPRNDSAAAL